MDEKNIIESGETALGIELGSTRIKAVLIDNEGRILGTGIYDWENSFVNGIWTYSIDEVRAGIRGCYSCLKADVYKKYGVHIKRTGSIGISAMMHGYIALDAENRLLSPFQTWRNTNTERAADELTELFGFNIPLRWSIAHLYQRILDGEAHVKSIHYVTTLAGYVHFLLTGERVLGIGDASGMFPIDSSRKDYNEGFIKKFEDKIAASGYTFKLREIFPKVLSAGDTAGTLTAEGAKLLDESGELEAGIRLCPPEGDAGTGMVATQAILPETGNFSAGTSMFAMLVLKEMPENYYREIDMVTTPDGYPVAMSHANNGTSDLNAWVKLFGEFSELAGRKMSGGELFEKLYLHSLNGDYDCGGLLSYGYCSGEGITHINEGRPLFVRSANSSFNLANFIRVHLYSSLTAVKLGLDILKDKEKVVIRKMIGHGGFFKTEGVGQRYLAAALGAPVEVMETAAEGGAYGMAVLALYLRFRENKSLSEFLSDTIFNNVKSMEIIPTEAEIKGFEAFAKRYVKGLEIERAAAEYSS